MSQIKTMLGKVNGLKRKRPASEEKLTAWMMKVYKWYVGNQKFPEGCITEQYLNEEAMRYCMEYIPSSKREIHSKEQRAALEDKDERGYPIDKKGKDYLLPSIQYQQAHKLVLRKSVQNADWEKKYETYLQGFKSRGKYRRIASPTQREMDYIPWLRKQLENEGESRFKRLADEMDTTTQNSGVSMKAFTNFRASAKDKNLVEDEATYYGIVKQILELDYHEFKETVFFCDLVRIEDRRNGCYVDPDTNLVFVNLERCQRNINEDDEPFILASEASQVFYCKNLSRDNWHVVLDAPKRLNHEVDAYEDPFVFEAMENSDGSASTLMGDIMEDDEIS
ncbi:hypothetical protein IFM89_036347 [Coptis chinensis]|uniref:DUF4216 domain-containing protein n=1 Tax=Coptis chinensis TaxID=261450 RepID=A0A835HGC8_9MAGN|nr:hypothetical protein IFM89_036347 [Coptis chinensis]